MDKLKEILKSRKFWAAIAGVAVIFVSAYAPKFPFTDEQVISVVGIIMSYILGTAIEARNGK